MFKNEINAEKFLKYLNSKHPMSNLLCKKNKFLVKNECRTSTTSVHRRKTSVGLFTQYHIFTPFNYNNDLTKYLFHRAFKINSSYIIFQNKINKIKN